MEMNGCIKFLYFLKLAVNMQIDIFSLLRVYCGKLFKPAAEPVTRTAQRKQAASTLANYSSRPLCNVY